jgi:hypothetical protein
MPKKRYIYTLPKTQRIIDMFRGLANVFADKQSVEPKSNTDVIGYALHYLGRKWRREDFSEIMDLTVRDIIEMVENNEWKHILQEKPEKNQPIELLVNGELIEGNFCCVDVNIGSIKDEEGNYTYFQWWKPA